MSASTPSPSTPPTTATSATAPAAGKVEQALRWWPAAVLLVIMAGLKYAMYTVESPPLPLMMASFFGPTWMVALIAIWWLGFSRAEWKEKLITAGGALLIAVIAILLVHASMRGMGVMVTIIPVGGAAFAIAMIALSQLRGAYRWPIALAITAVAFGYWDLVQSDGVTGGFRSQYRWRWDKTAEELYLASRGPRTTPRPDVPTTTTPETTPATDDVPISAAEWPSFRGPDRNGRVPGVALSENWEAKPPKEQWRRLIGPGWSSFTVAGPRLFTQEQRGENEAVVCLDATTGNEVWSYEYPGRFWEAIAGAGPRATPTLADGGVFTLGAQGMLHRLDPRTGKVVWKQDLKAASGRDVPMWGFSSSPLVTTGVVIVHAGGSDDKGVFAFDAATGDRKWSVASGDHSYSSPQLATLNGVTGVLMATNAGVQFLSPETGEQLWDYKFPFEGYRALQPLVMEQTLLIATGMGVGTRRVEVSKSDGDWSFDDAWTSLDMKSDFNDFVEHKGTLYGFDSTIFAAIDLKTGKRHWKKGRYGAGQVLLLPDGDQLLVLAEQGDVVLLHATSEKCDERARFKALTGKTWNHPVLIGSKLYLRNAEEAACFELELRE